MRKALFVAAALLALASILIGDLSAQGRRVRRAPAGGGGGGGGGTGEQTLLSSADIGPSTYLGAWAQPATISTPWGDNLQSYYGDALTFYNEPGDSGNRHFLTLGYGSNGINSGLDIDANATAGGDISGSGIWGLGGGPWVAQTGSGAIVYSNANRMRGNASGPNAYYADDTTPNNQFAQAKMYRFTNAGVAGVAVRMATGSLAKYACVYDAADNRWELQEHDAAGSITEHATSAATLTNGSIYMIRLEAKGSALECYIALPSFGGETRLSATDSTLASGRAGIYLHDAQTNSTGYHLYEYRSGNADSDVYTLWQGRVPAFQNPSPATTLSSYNNYSATGQKVYSNTLWQRKRWTYYEGFLLHMGSTLNGDYTLFMDEDVSKLYLSAYYGYLQGQCPVPQFMRSTLNYAAGDGTSEGSWFLDGVQAKSTAAFMWKWPSSFVTAANLGAKTLAIGGGSPYSIISECDSSMGPSVQAIEPPASGLAALTAVPFTSTMGYQPYADAPGTGKGRMTRSTAWIQSPVFPYDASWGTTKFQQEDYTYGGTYVETANRRGVAFAIEQGQGLCNYQNSGLACEYYRPHIAIYDPDDLAAVARNEMNRYDIQPVEEFELNLPFLDYNAPPWGEPTPIDIVSIDATAGVAHNASITNLPLVTTATPHGLTGGPDCGRGGNRVSIRDTSADSQFKAIWVVVETPSATTFTICNSSDSATFNGTDATGGQMRKASSHGSNSIGIRSMQFDTVTGVLNIDISTINSGVARRLTAGFQIP